MYFKNLWDSLMPIYNIINYNIYNILYKYFINFNLFYKIYFLF